MTVPTYSHPTWADGRPAPTIPDGPYAEFEALAARGLSRVIGIEVKLRVDDGPTAELGMWVPDRELLIPIRGGYHQVEFPCTVHTTHGDRNYASPLVL